MGCKRTTLSLLHHPNAAPERYRYTTSLFIHGYVKLQGKFVYNVITVPLYFYLEKMFVFIEYVIAYIKTNFEKRKETVGIL